MKRAVCIAIVLLASACTPPATTPETPAAPADTPSPDATTEALLGVLTPLVSAEVGKPVNLITTTVNVTDQWSYVVAQPRNADGSEIDWTTTNLASRYENGAMDTGGSVHALLKNENGVWTVLEYVLAPTDVAWLDWAARHGAPASVVETPAAN